MPYRRGRRDWKWYLIPAAVIVGAGIFGYTQFLSPLLHSTLLRTHPAYVVLGDVSLDSTPATRARARKVLVEVIDHAREEQGFVAATPFQDAAIANADWHSEDFLPDEDDLHDTDGTERHLKERAHAFKDETAHLFVQKRHVDGTDIIGALITATDQAKGFTRATSRAVIIVSNMANVDYGENGVILKEPLAATTIQDKLEILNRLGEIPHQQGIYFYVVGGGEIPGEAISPDVQGTIRKFWNGYFGLSGGKPALWAAGLSWPLPRKRISLSP